MKCVIITSIVLTDDQKLLQTLTLTVWQSCNAITTYNLTHSMKGLVDLIGDSWIRSRFLIFMMVVAEKITTTKIS